MAAGLAVLEVIDEDDIQQNAKVRGAQLKAGLQCLERDHKLVGDVRGMGLMLGVELVRDRVTKEPAKSEAVELLEAVRSSGLLIGKGGLDGNILRIKPPMCITAADVEFAVDVLHDGLAAVGGK
jgi:alanine-glyoxylate transaminase / (R)-3-amino-2-methylpropionate-pyruvate transaminase